MVPSGPAVGTWYSLPHIWHFEPFELDKADLVVSDLLIYCFHWLLFLVVEYYTLFQGKQQFASWALLLQCVHHNYLKVILSLIHFPSILKSYPKRHCYIVWIQFLCLQESCRNLWWCLLFFLNFLQFFLVTLFSRFFPDYFVIQFTCFRA